MIGKKGFLDVFFIMVFLLVILVIGLVMYILADALTPTELFTYNNDTVAIGNIWYNILDTFDYMIVLMWFLLLVGSAILAYRLRTSPVFIIGAVFILAIITMLSAVVSNVYEEITEDDQLADANDNFPLSAWFFGLLPMWTLISGVIIMVVTYAFGGDD